MKRRDFFKAAVAVGIVAPVALAQASLIPESDPLDALITWVEESFACEQGLIGPYADEEGKHPYVTFRLAVLSDKYPGGEAAAKRALVDELRLWLQVWLYNARRESKVSRPVLIWRTPIQINEGTLYVEGAPVRSMRIRTRLFIPGDQILVGVPERTPTRYLA